MRVISATGVNDAWPQAIQLLDEGGAIQNTRAGTAVVYPRPVATVYSKPTQRVLFDPVRDANPIFHVHEALWMLAGRADAEYLDVFVRDFGERFAEPDGRIWGAYGRRWRSWFGSGESPLDQLTRAVDLLRVNRSDRQVVIGMWDPEADLGTDHKDRPCNTQVYLRGDCAVLDMTVMCRSNDAVFGCYGANAVHFSMLQEYLAARIGIPVGSYTQFSNNLHMYDWAREKVDYSSAASWIRDVRGRYPEQTPLVDYQELFDAELVKYMSWPTSAAVGNMSNRFFPEVASPMYRANGLRLEGRWQEAIDVASSIGSEDWRIATVAWLRRRANRAMGG